VSHLERVGTMMEMSCLFTRMFVCFVHGKAFIAVGLSTVALCGCCPVGCCITAVMQQATGQRQGQCHAVASYWRARVHSIQ
jgi:hypothetical protein